MKIEIKKDKGADNLDFFLKEVTENIVGKVGWFPSLKYENGAPVAGVAAIQEFGSAAKKIPPRPFMRPTISQKSGTWRQTATKMAERMVAGKATYNDLLDVVGQQASANVRETIESIQSPALKESTIANRLRPKRDKKTIGLADKPLVDTGTMLNTITNTVEKK